MFLTLMVVGLAGLVMMALPALGRLGHGHGHGPSVQIGRGGGHGGLHQGAHGGAALKLGGLRGAGAVLKGAGAKGAATSAATGTAATSGAAAGAGQALARPDATAVETLPAAGLSRFIPSPRLVCSFLALYGAFGNALVHAGHLSPLLAAFVAVLPAALVERFAVTPVWNLLFRFQGQPSSPLGELILTEARAVTPFRNGRGLVSLVRDGRLVQFSARLVEPQASAPVRVGDRLLVEEVDAEHERLTVSVPEE
jgi:hypothetical protein